MENVISSLEKNQVFKKIKGFENKKLCVRGLNLSERAFVCSLQKSGVIVVSDIITANKYYSFLKSLGFKVEIAQRGFDTPMFVFAQDLSGIKNLISCVSRFISGHLDFLIVNVEALFQRLPEKHKLFPIEFETGASYNTLSVVEKFVSFGYKRTNICSCSGEFSVRGDIIDVFPVGEENPIRLDFFDDALEKIYHFNLESMEKIDTLKSCVITPQTVFYQDSSVQTEFKNSFKNVNVDLFQDVISAFEKDMTNLNLAFTLPFYHFENNILSFADGKVFFDEPKKLFQTIESLKSGYENEIERLIFEEKLLNVHKNFYFNDFDFSKIKNYTVFENIISSTNFSFDEEIKLECAPSKRYVFDYNSLFSDLKMLVSNDIQVVLFAGDKSTKSNLSSLLTQKGFSILSGFDFSKQTPGVYICENELFSSVKIWDSKIFLISTYDLVKKKEKTQLKKKSSVYLPKINEYVVHDFHGVGKCIDVVRMKLGESERDYFVVEYFGGDKVYIPSEQADSISAYVGGEVSPKLNKLGGLEFAKVKEKAKKNIQALAIDLLKLYKERESAKGFVFEQDSYLQEEFENCFEFQETADQLYAIEQVKKDMCSTKIMDRLICGDVGYGKTEVALRAIYKAVLSGKQVAFLVPTTILAQQHYKTCQKRFKDFMVRTAVLNRLVPSNVQKQVISDLKDGKIDLIIGTHRLLNDDIVFKDLGLLVLDEEQRFGVGDKEKIKDIKKDIDVLTLSATPIPRTLHMSLSGIRDITLIETPPKTRISVQTFVCEFDEKLIFDACTKEFSRNGQVLMVYNRVETIYDFANYISSILPNVKIGVAHGQMPPKMLEDSILKLYNGEIQMLIATTLIESGVDLPNANTLIVIDSDRLGLSSLYQLKGRVGRSDRVAYAYFTYKKDKVLTEDAYKRLSAICEFSSLGSGFKIALRDLEIRGAGSILGKQQHGHIEKVGYDLYCRLLNETLSEMRGEIKKQKREIKMDIDIDAFIGQDYIEDESARISVYSQISQIETISQAKEIYENLKNSFNSPTKQVLNLMAIALLKNTLCLHNVKRVLINNKTCRLYLYKEENVIDDYLSSLMDKSGCGVLKFETLPIIEFDFGVEKTELKCEKLLNLLFDGEKFEFE